MIVSIKRDAEQRLPYCTLGILTVPGSEQVFQSVEKPWVPWSLAECGHPQTSCIGTGVYLLEKRETEARGRHWIISNPALHVYQAPGDVPLQGCGRSLVLIHAANWAHELLGCIAPGKERQYMNGEWGVTKSRQAMLELHALLDLDQDLALEIK